MCGLYTREINLNPYFLYSQHGIRVKLKPILANFLGHSTANGPLTNFLSHARDEYTSA